MPTYVYTSTKTDAKPRGCDVCSGTFEIVQRMSDAALTQCPHCDGAVERVILAPNVAGANAVKKPSEDRLKQAGFTQYRKQGKGYYEKSFGSGPSSLHPE